MKTIGPAFFMCVLLHTTGFAFQRSPAAEENLTKGRAILQKTIAATGGSEKFAKINNFRIKTASKIFGQQTTLELTVTETVEFPDKTRQFFELAAGQRIQVLDGNVGWKKSGGTVTDLTEAERREMKRGLFRDTINLFKRVENDGLRTEYFGEEIVGGDTLFVVHIKDKTGEFFNVYVNARTFLIEKKSYQGGPEALLATLQEIYSDYRDVQGVKIPFHTVVTANGKKFIESRVLEVMFNVELSNDFFLKE
ncbi:MAG: hypothetical protein ACE5G1_03555 [bacterium]